MSFFIFMHIDLIAPWGKFLVLLSMHSIPKLVHVAWPDLQVVNCDHPLIENGLTNLIQLNPSWSVKISTDEEIDHYLKSSLDQHDYSLIADAHIVAKSDVWRLLKMYQEGGLYVDLDRLCNQTLDTAINSQTKCVLPTVRNWDFSQDMMLSAPNNPIYLATLKLHFERRKQAHTGVYFLGAQTFMHTITQIIMGKIINTNPGDAVFDQIRQQIGQIDFIQTYQEHPPLDTWLYSHNPQTWKGSQCPVTPEDHEKLKRSLYQHFKITHWTGEW